jgi:hypothetical protein
MSMRIAVRGRHGLVARALTEAEPQLGLARLSNRCAGHRLAIIAVAHNLLSKPDEPQLRGIFNLASSEETNWADFAATIFAILARKGVRTPW